MKVAIVHYWLDKRRGGEKVLEHILAMYPDADIFTHILEGEMAARLRHRKIHTTFVQKLPFSRRLYPLFLPLMPIALEALDLNSYDLVISSESGPAKGVVPAPHALHICYCHSPMRYLWDQRFVYADGMNRFSRLLFHVMGSFLRVWDQASSTRVDRFIANSTLVASRIKRFYGREAQVIHPPVDLTSFNSNSDSSLVANRSYFLMVGELVEYKNVRVALEVFSKFSNEKLRVVGGGPLKSVVRKRAEACENIEYLGRVSDRDLVEYYRGAKALIFPGVEDFGIVPLEAMACGTPIIGLAKGGLLDSVNEGKTGILYSENSPAALTQAVHQFCSMPETVVAEWRAACIERASCFSSQQFSDKIALAISDALIEHASAGR